MSKLYQFIMKDIDGSSFSFEQLEGKVVLIVNTASKCGFTPQYEGLEALFQKFKKQDFVILGFPSNDFLMQEPGSNMEIKSFCTIHYGVSFPIFEKIHVRGRSLHPLFQFLTKDTGIKRLQGSIKWNFTKFLFDRKGQLVNRFSPFTKPEQMEKTIQGLL